MDYPNARAYLDSFVNLERGPLDRQARGALSLDNVRVLADMLGYPERRFPSLHIAGTKGKGSTCAFAAALLRAQGLRVGVYTSPHLEDVRERIRIDDTDIPPAEFAHWLTHLQPHLETLRARSDFPRKPTYFEILTHLAFLWFAAEKVDVAVVEVGLGGRLDATTIVHPAVCGIANISFDHTAILGHTLGAIAGEKAGIFKPGIPAFSVPQHPEARAALELAAKQTGTPLTVLASEVDFGSHPSPHEPWPQPHSWILRHGARTEARLNLRGAHQVENWALAVRMVETFFAGQGAALNDRMLLDGSQRVVWPCRLEAFTCNGVRVFLDGAHNAASLDAVLREGRPSLSPDQKLVCVFGCARDKDIDGMLSLLAASPGAPHRVIFTDSLNPRTVPPRELLGRFIELGGTNADVEDAPEQALKQALNGASPNDVVLVTGSLYLVGKVRNSLSGSSS